ncbi:MAG: hypothetical protein KY461_03825 [Actinobacteria bacterium]|nr:hypothetical protein [Actinomycetota bacterium]
MAPSLPERRGLPGALARLDRRLVPALQRGARRVARGLGAPLRLVARAEERLFPGLVRRVVPGWRVPALLAAVLVVLASAVHMQRYPDLRDGGGEVADGPRAPAAAAPTTGAVDPLDLSGRSVGPRQDAELAPYVAERKAALAELPADGSAVAVVSFEEYTTAAEALAAVPGDVQVLRAQYRIPAEGERPQETLVPADGAIAGVESAVAAALAPIEDEITEVESLLASDTVEDPAFEADLERRLSELRAVRNLLEAAPAVVFALVVEGPVTELRVLAEHGAVRLVDPAPAGADAEETAFYGLLPEDREFASFGTAR